MQQSRFAATVLLLIASLGSAAAACGGAVAPVDGNENPQPLGPYPDPAPPTPNPTPTPNPNPPPIGTTPAPTPVPSSLPPLPPPDAPPPGGEAEHLQWMKTNIVGTWRGVAKSPWTPPHDVEITFGADLHYSAHCLNTSGCAAFYYGDDQDSPTRVYDLIDVLANHEGVGTLYPWSSAGSWTGDLKRVTFRGNASRLTFDFYNRSYGPIVYDLVRVP